MKKDVGKNSNDINSRFAENFFSSLNDNDLGELLSYFSEEASLVFPGSNALGGFYLGKGKIKKFFDKLFILVPDINFKIINIVSSQKLLIVEWMSQGITKKGLPYENKGVSILEIENSLIKEMRLYLDTEKIKNP